MNEFSEPLSLSNGDPLERLVEAFVEHPVPAGPDAAMRRRLVTAMRSADSVGQRATIALPAAADQPDRTCLVRGARWWLTLAARQTAAVAAGIVVVVAAALFMTARPNDAPLAEAPRTVDAIAAAMPAPANLDAAVESTTSQEIGAIIDRFVVEYHRTHGGQLPPQRTINAMIAAVLKDNPNLAQSEPWRYAQQRLVAALEQPEVIGLGVGLLGTLPWTTYGRF